MDLRLRDSWVKNLRSGEFIQGSSQLCRVDGDGHKSYCCLGVLADTLGSLVTFNDIDSALVSNRSTKLGSTGVFVQSELTLLGLTEDQQASLVRMNDNENRSFAAIADWIEENL